MFEAAGLTRRAHHDTAPIQPMTAAEMLQAVSNIREDAAERLQSVQAQIEELEAEAERLQEVLA